MISWLKKIYNKIALEIRYRKKLKELGVIINLIWNRLNENSIEIKYLPQCPEDRECYKKRMSYVFSDRGEEKKF